MPLYHVTATTFICAPYTPRSSVKYTDVKGVFDLKGVFGENCGQPDPVRDNNALHV